MIESNLVSGKYITLAKPPEPAGFWILPGATPAYCTQFPAWKKPRWITRKLMYWLLEFEWKD